MKFYFPSWSTDMIRNNTDSILKSTQSLILPSQNNISGGLCMVEQKAIIFLLHWSNFEIKCQV